MASTDVMELGLVPTPALRLATLLREIEVLQAELEDLERRVVESDGRLIEDDLDAPPPAGAEALARRVAEELLRRGRAEIAASLGKAEQDARAVMAPAPAHAHAGDDGGGAVRQNREMAPVGRPTAHPNEAGSAAPGVERIVVDLTAGGANVDVVPELDRLPDRALTFGEFWSETDAAAAPGRWRRWARPAEILLHLVVLLVLIALAMGAVG